MKKQAIFTLCLIAWTCITADAVACRYNVRDVGFVDLRSATYLLEIHKPTAEIRRAVAAAILDSNVRVAYLDATKQKAVLISPDDRRLNISLGRNENEIIKAAAAVTDSPMREKLLRDAVDHHSVVLIAEGRNEAYNQTAHRLAARSIKRIAQTMASLPKAIEKPPTVCVIPNNRRHSEAVLLWSLGVDNDDSESAYIAVLFGRGRLLGSVMAVPGATQMDIGRRLAYVGQDCECNLDRSWMHGPMIPHIWNDEIIKRAVEQLGFDPGSPMVKAEVSRILSRNTGTVATRDAPTDSVLGYTEIDIDDNPPPISPASKSIKPNQPALQDTDSIGSVVIVTLVLIVFVALLGGGIVILVIRRNRC